MGLTVIQKYDWSNIPKEVNWIATDLSKVAQGYVKEPTVGFDTWVTDSIKYWLHLPGYLEEHWEDSLEKRPLME
jgi:hypothetical protein